MGNARQVAIRWCEPVLLLNLWSVGLGAFGAG